MIYRIHYETELIILIWKTVFFQSDSTPAIYAGESRLCLINTEVCEVGFFYFRWVTLVFAGTVIQWFDCIIQCGSGERCIGYKLQSVAADIKQSPPTDISFGTGFLRADVRIELFFYRLAVFADPCGVVTVRIVFTWSASVIFYLKRWKQTRARRFPICSVSECSCVCLSPLMR